MALVPCRECGKEVSDQAEKCPYCGIKTPSAKHRKIKLAITLIVVLLVVGASAWAYHRVSQIFSPPSASDSTVVTPKIQKDVPVKQQIIQKDANAKIKEMLDSGMSVMSISKQTGIRIDEVRKIKKEWKQSQKDK